MYDVKMCNIFLSSPGDLKNERQEIKQYIEQNIKFDRIKLEVILWEKNMPSIATEDAQEEINKILLDPSDILIGIFCKKFGSKTPSHPSGTVEEIEACIAQKKPVILYFLNTDLSTGNLSLEDIEELKKIIEFKKAYQNKGVYVEVNKIEDIKDRLRLDIESNIQRIRAYEDGEDGEDEEDDEDDEDDDNDEFSLSNNIIEGKIDLGCSNFNNECTWYKDSISDLINKFLPQKQIDYRYIEDITFRENLLFAMGSIDVYIASTIEEFFNRARIYAFNEKYGDYDYSKDIRNHFKKWYFPIRKIIKREVGTLDELKVLDVGGNTGIELFQIFGKNTKSSYTVLDISDEAIRKGQISYKNVQYFQGNMEKEYPFRTAFDICLCLRSIQSRGVFRNDALVQMSKHVKKGGLLLLSIPNGYLTEEGKIKRGLYDHRTQTFFRRRPFELANKIEGKIQDYGFTETGVETIDTEMLIWGIKE